VAADPTKVAQECVEGYLFHTPPLRMLIFRRPPSRGQIWVPVSGKVDPTDPDFLGALRRELIEETGIRDPTRVFPLDWHVTFEVSPGVTWRLHAYGVELPRELIPVLSVEHERFEWVAPEEAVKRLHYEDNREAVRRLVSMLGNASATRPPNL
jgi:8-oxo-dGTP pyrophosphatase MutT (NUDIX family)